MVSNKDADVVEDFGREWSTYDQSSVSEGELRGLFENYFMHFPWATLADGAEGFDLGCGSGRWAKFAAPRVGTLHCIDASEAALDVAKRNLKDTPNCVFHHASVDQIPLPDASMDFGYSVGVLHHVPDTQAGIRDCTRKLKPGAPFLLYLYYALDNRPAWFRILWKLSNLGRVLICRLPFAVKKSVCKLIATLVYFPLARFAFVLEKLGANVKNFPLTEYRHLSFYTMSTDALDRFGTKLEQRFTKQQVTQMMTNAGLENIQFHSQFFWVAVGYKK